VFFSHLSAIQQRCRIVQFGTKVGKIIKNKLQPEHDSITSTALDLSSFPVVEISYENAVSFLKKETFHIDNLPLGWVILSYETVYLGWIKSVGNRFNNYYPNELKIFNPNLKSDFSVSQFLHFNLPIND
jgi:NOL1/NOP2/fmu family ribosome biogenesis protein